MFVLNVSASLLKKIVKLFCLSFLFVACSQPEMPIAEEGEDYLFHLMTDQGELSFILFDETALHKSNFLKLVQEGFYNDLLIHRVVPSLLFQFGDPTSKGALLGERLGMKEKGNKIPPEINNKFFHRKGAIAAARKPDKANPLKQSSGSQVYFVQGKVFDEEGLDALYVKYDSMYYYFEKLMLQPIYESIADQYQQLVLKQPSSEEMTKFILNYRALIENEFGVELLTPRQSNTDDHYMKYGGIPELDNDYTVFGQVISGFYLLEKITAVSVDKYQRPQQDILIKKLDYQLINVDVRDSLLSSVGLVY